MATSRNTGLDAIRNQIDAIDLELLRLLSDRARCAQQVAQLKLGNPPAPLFQRGEDKKPPLEKGVVGGI